MTGRARERMHTPSAVLSSDDWKSDRYGGTPWHGLGPSLRTQDPDHQTGTSTSPFATKKTYPFLSKNIDMSLAQSASFTNISTPLKSTRLPSDAYVLSLAALPSRYAASASAPSNKIHLFDTHSLRAVQSLSGHEGGTTSLRAVDAIIGTNQRSLVSSGKNGTVKVWDDRAGSVAIQSMFSFLVVSPSTRRFDHSKNKSGCLCATCTQ